MKTGNISIKSSGLRLKTHNRELSLLLELSNLLSAGVKLPDLLDEALSLVLDHFRLDAGRIYLLHSTGQFLTLAACRGMDPEGLERIGIGEGFSGTAVRTRSFIAQYVSELDDRERANFLSSLGLIIVICVPLVVRDEIFGVMNLAAKKVIELDQNEIDLLIAVANQIAIAASQAGLYQDIENKRKMTEFFTYSVSHDLRSPAVGAFGLAQLLERQFGNILGEKGKTYCEQIRKATKHIVSLVDDMKTYIAEKQSPLHIEEFDLEELAEAIKSEFDQALGELRVRWVQPGTGMVIRADRLSIGRAIQNLVDNALKYGGKNLTQIRIDWREEEDNWIFYVADDGAGLGKETPECLFQVFSRGESASGISGTGLGLAIVKEAAERHNGRAWVEPVNGGGIKFCLSVSKHLCLNDRAL